MFRNIEYRYQNLSRTFQFNAHNKNKENLFTPKFYNENYYGYVLCSVCEMTTKAYKCIGWGSFLIENVLSDNEDFLTN